MHAEVEASKDVRKLCATVDAACRLVSIADQAARSRAVELNLLLLTSRFPSVSLARDEHWSRTPGHDCCHKPGMLLQVRRYAAEQLYLQVVGSELESQQRAAELLLETAWECQAAAKRVQHDLGVLLTA